MVESANNMSLDDPNRCAAYSAVEQEFRKGYYAMPTIGLDYAWLVQAWMICLESSVNNDFLDMCEAKVAERIR